MLSKSALNVILRDGVQLQFISTMNVDEVIQRISSSGDRYFTIPCIHSEGYKHQAVFFWNNISAFQITEHSDLQVIGDKGNKKNNG